MTEVYVGQIMMTGYGFASRGLAQCNGQLMAVTQNQALFALLGTTYGGNGTTNFQLPNLQSRAPAGYGTSVDPSWQPSGYALGQLAGAETVTLLPGNLPQHNHGFNATTTVATAKNPSPGADLYGQGSTGAALTYGPATGQTVSLLPASLGTTGNTQPHENMQPFTVINFNICLSGVFPTRN